MKRRSAPRKKPTVTDGRSTVQASDVAIAFAKPFEPVLEAVMNVLNRLIRSCRADAAGACGSSAHARRRPCERMRYLNSTGTSVNESTRLAASEMITESDSGENRYLAVPVKRKTGTNTTQIDNVERKVGTATSPRRSTIACSSPLAQADMTLDVLDHHRRVVDENADRQRKAAQRHRVERLAAEIERPEPR